MSAPINAAKPPAPKPPAPKPADPKPQAQPKNEPPKADQAQAARKNESVPAPKNDPKPQETTPQQPRDSITRTSDATDSQPDTVSDDRQAQFSGFADNFGGANGSSADRMGGTVGERNSTGIWNPDRGGPEPGPTDNARNEAANTGTTTVTVQPWGTGKNDSVWTSLTAAGYTDQQIVEQGLVEQVAQTNKLDDPNVVNPGQQLIIPNTPGGPNPNQPVDPNNPSQPPADPNAPPDPNKPMTAQELDANSDPAALQQRQYAATFNQNFDQFDAAGAHDHKTDGVVSRGDIEAIANGTVYADANTKAAAQYYLQNPDAMRGLDQAGAADADKGKGDNKIARTDAEANLNAANQRVRDTGRTEEERKAYDANRNRVNDNALQTLEQNFEQFAGKDGVFKKEELARLAQDQTADPAMRDAAQFLMNNPDRLNNADGLNAGPDKKPDGTFALADIKNARIDTFNDLRNNPDAQRQAQVDQQHGIKWDSPQAALQNLQENPDLSTYTDDQLLALHQLAAQDPAARELLASTTGNYVNNHTNSIDDLPGNQGFQATLHQQVVSPETLDGLSPEARKSVEDAQNRLKGQVNTELENTLKRNLDGKKGDAAVDEAIQGYGNDLKGLAEKNPALLPYLKDGAESPFKNKDILEQMEGVREADDGPVGNFFESVGNGIKSGLSGAGDVLGDVLSFSPGAFVLDKIGLDGPADFLRDVGKGAVDRPIESLFGGVGDFVGGTIADPLETAKGLYELSAFSDLADLAGGKPINEVFSERMGKFRAIGESFIADYTQTFEQDGAVAGVSHVVSDIATTILTGGTGKVPKVLDLVGDVSRSLGNVGDASRTLNRLPNTPGAPHAPDLPNGPNPTPNGPNPTPNGPDNTPNGPNPTPNGPNPTPNGPNPTPNGPDNTPDGPNPTPNGPDNTPNGPDNTPDSPSNTSDPPTWDQRAAEYWNRFEDVFQTPGSLVERLFFKKDDPANPDAPREFNDWVPAGVPMWGVDLLQEVAGNLQGQVLSNLPKGDEIIFNPNQDSDPSNELLNRFLDPTGLLNLGNAPDLGGVVNQAKDRLSDFFRGLGLG